MKKNTYSVLLISLLHFVSFAQNKEETTTSTNEYTHNKWSLEFNLGQSKGINPYSEGYYANDPEKIFGSFALNHFSVGARYMFSPKFGLKFDGSYDYLQDIKNSGSLDFEMLHLRVGMQGVINGPRLFDIQNQLGRFGFLIHGGVQVAYMSPQIGINKDKSELAGGIMIGVTPQLRITNKTLINLDLTLNSNLRQHYNWDGGISDSENNLTGRLYTISMGVSYSLGAEKTHGDFATIVDQSLLELSALEDRIAKIETDLNDTDRDGVPDYLDAEPNSITGIAVDTRGVMVDSNGNGVPDQLERYMQNNYTTYESAKLSNKKMIVDFINDGYVATYFDFDKSTPTNVSTEGIDFMLTFLRNNPKESIDIIGHADEIGKSPYNDKLAKERAESVKQTLIKAGIEPSRLNTIASGEDSSVEPNSVEARRLVRRVTFRTK